MKESRHLIFSDESGYDGSSRFGCLAKVSGAFDDVKSLNEDLKKYLLDHRKTEIKFKKIKNHNDREIAIKFIRTGLNYLNNNKIKVHVLVWDKQDARHQVANRCDIENLKRMYYHNLLSLKRHWNINTSWEFYPDEFSAIDWQNDVIKYLSNTNINKNTEYQANLFEGILEDITVKQPKYNRVQELDSKSSPIIQLADLFAGIVRTSRVNSDTFPFWYQQVESQSQYSLFERESVCISNSQLPKFEVIREFKKQSDNLKLGVSLSSTNYLKTYGKKSNLSIWHYEPQGEYDKAPQKIKTNRGRI